MSTRPNPLRDAMQGIQGRAPGSPITAVALEPMAASPSRVSPIAPSRKGKRSVAGHFTPEVARQLRVLAAEADRTVQDLLAEALNDLFRKHNRSPIA